MIQFAIAFIHLKQKGVGGLDIKIRLRGKIYCTRYVADRSEKVIEDQVRTNDLFLISAIPKGSLNHKIYYSKKLAIAFIGEISSFQILL